MHPEQYTIDELMCVLMARQIRNGDWVNHGASVPLSGAALALAKRLHAPDLDYFFLGTVFKSISPAETDVSRLILQPELVHASSRASISDADIIDWTLRGGCDFQFLRPIQIDRYGSVNISVVGSPAAPRYRFHGIAAADAMVLVKRICLYVTEHTPDVLCETLAYRTGLGHVGGGAWRRRLGAPGGGPETVITPLCVLDFETPDRCARLRSVHPGHAVDSVVEATGFKLVVPDDVPESAPPEDRELTVLRQEIDPLGVRQLEFRSMRTAAEERLAQARAGEWQPT
jgi:glutaconate CoA-transferase subunit B